MEKRHRETKKKQKAEEKRARRQRRKEAAGSPEVLNGDEPSMDPSMDQQ
jgi:hypothetical protein